MAMASLLSVQAQSVQIGTHLPAEEVKLQDVDGRSITLKDAKKKNGLLVMFSCNTCPFVVKNQARTKEINAYAASKNIGVVVINSNEALRRSADSPEEIQKYAQKQAYQWSYVIDADSKVADAFGASKTPEVFLFDKDGKLVYKGAIDDNPSDADKVSRKHLQIAIDEMTAGKEVSQKESRSVGCTIKRKEA